MTRTNIRVILSLSEAQPPPTTASGGCAFFGMWNHEYRMWKSSRDREAGRAAGGGSPAVIPTSNFQILHSNFQLPCLTSVPKCLIFSHSVSCVALTGETKLVTEVLPSKAKCDNMLQNVTTEKNPVAGSPQAPPQFRVMRSGSKDSTIHLYRSSIRDSPLKHRGGAA